MSMMISIAIAPSLVATPQQTHADPLMTEIGVLDAKVFDAYNCCDLATFSGYFDPKVTF
jgi:hypothetical protein